MNNEAEGLTVEELQRQLRELTDTIEGYRGRQAQLEQTVKELTTARDDALAQLADLDKKHSAVLERLPALEKAERDAQKLVQLADHPNLLSNKAMRKLVLAADMDIEDLKDSLEGANDYFAQLFAEDAIGDDEGEEPPSEPSDEEGEPAAQSNPEPPQTPPSQGGDSGFDGVRTLAAVQADIQEAIGSGDTNRVMSLMQEQMNLQHGGR